MTDAANLVIVANRLPVDRVTDADGSADVAPLPRRAGHRARAGDARQRRRLDRLAGRHRRRDLEPFDEDGLLAGPGVADRRRRSRSSTRASPTAPCGRSTTTSSPSRSSTASGGTPTSTVNQRFADAGRRGRRRGRHRVGAGLPAAAGARRCCASCGPTCGSASTCTSRSRRPSCSPQLPWRRQILEGLLGADLVGFQLPGGAANFVRLVRQRVGHKTHRDTVYLPDGRTVQARGVPDLDRHRRLRGAGPVRGGRRSAPTEIREALGNPRKIFLGVDRLDYTKGIYARLRAFGELVARRRTSTSRTRSSSRSRRRRASASSSTASSATTSTGWSAGSTATSAGSAARRSPTCTRPTRARRWPRSTAPPTSWSSRRSATA